MQSLHLAIGVFDGVHAGHRYLIGEAIEQAKRSNSVVGALTFHPHPKKVPQLPNAPQLIYPIQQRYWLLKKFGCRYVFVKKFTDAWSQYSPDRFFTYLQRLFPLLSDLYVGEDFHFGHNREGDTQRLEQLCQASQSVKLHVFKHLHYQQERICSSRIRLILSQGDISMANTLLSQPYHCIGYIDNNTYFIHHSELKLKDGDYACILKNKNGQQCVNTRIFDGHMSITSPVQDIFQHKACILEFQRNLKK